MGKTKTIENAKQRTNNAINAITKIKNEIPTVEQKTFNFKGRKSTQIMTPLLKALLPNGGFVGDPFVGSNSFGMASVNAGLKFAGSELDNYTYSVLKSEFTKYDQEKFIKLFNIIKNCCKKTIMDLYETECCGHKNYISKLHFDPEGNGSFSTPEYKNPKPHRDIIDNETIIMSYNCPICGKKRKKFTDIDEDKINECNKLDTSIFPHHELIENSRINITRTQNASKYDRNFTNRAKYGLLLIQTEINKLPSCIERDILENCLVSSLTLSRICQYGSGSEYIYHVMKEKAQEKNVWEIFESKVQAFLQFKNTYSLEQCDNISSNDKMILTNEDYRDFLQKNKNTFDIICTDPPYTDQVPYLERSQLYRDWLHKFYDSGNEYELTSEMLKKEVVITDAPKRASTKKGTIQYMNDINDFFKDSYNALKANGLLILDLKLGTNKYLSTLAEYINLSRKNGFEMIGKYCIDKDDPTIRKQAARKNTMAKEMIVFFVKLEDSEKYWFSDYTNMDFEVTKFIYNKIKNTNDGIAKTELVKECLEYLRTDFMILSTDTVINRISKIINDNFEIIPNSHVVTDQNKLYLEVEDTSDLFTKLYNTIPVIIKNLSNSDGFTLEDLYFELINSVLNGNNNALNQIIEDKTYETQIKILLSNYCEMDNSDKYTLKKKNYSKNQNSVDISSMDGYEFEKLIQRLLEAENFYDVIRIGGAGDLGVDVMAKKQINGEVNFYIVQCKRWVNNVGSVPLQRLHSMKQIRCPQNGHAICVTTSDYTKDAKYISSQTGVEIINGKELIDKLDKVFPGEYYHALLDL